MTNIRALNQYENQLAFEMLGNMEFDPKSQAKVKGVKLELNETADDTVMLNGDNLDINAKEGSNTVYLSGSNNVVNAGDGTNLIALWGKNSTAIAGSGDDYMYLEGEGLTATSISGNNEFRVYGNNNKAISGSGNAQVGVLGDGNKVILAKGNHKIAYYGDNNMITTGKGNSSVMTLDYALMSGKTFLDMEDRWLKTLKYTNSSEKIIASSINDYACSTNVLYTSMNPEDIKWAENVDLTETVDGHPKYVVSTDANGNAFIFVYSFTYKGHNYYYPRGKEGQIEYKVAIDSSETQNVAYGKSTYYTMNYNKNYQVDGVSGNLIALGDGDNILKHTVRDNTNDVGLGKATTGHKLEQQTAYIFTDTEEDPRYEYTIVEKQFYVH